MSELLDIDFALKLLDNQKDLLNDLLNDFINDKLLNPSYLLDLEKISDKTQAAKYVHYFKGAARQLGANKLAESGQNLETALRNSIDCDLKKLTDIFTQDYADTYKAIESYLKCQERN